MIEFTQSSIDRYKHTGLLEVIFLGRKSLVSESQLDELKKDADEVLSFRFKVNQFLVSRGVDQETIKKLFENLDSVHVVDRIYLNFGLTCERAVEFLSERISLKHV